MAQEKDYINGVPTSPPEGMLDWLIKSGGLSKNVIVYKSEYVTDIEGNKQKMVACRCTACKRDFYEEYASNGGCNVYRYTSAPFGFINGTLGGTVINGDDTLCSQCGSAVQAIHIGAIYGEGGRLITDEYPITVHKINGLIYLLSWRVSKWVKKSGEVKIYINPYEGYAFDGLKAVKIVGYEQWYSYHYTGEWKKRAKCIDTYGKAKYIFPFEADMFNGTCLENSKFDVFVREVKLPAPVTYLRIYQKHKNVENIVVQGASTLLSSMIEQTQHQNYCRRGYTGYIADIDWKAKRPSEMLGLNKDEFKQCINNKWTLSELNLYRFAKKNGILLSEEEVKLCNKFGIFDFQRFLDFDRPRSVSVIRCFRYLLKQKEINVNMGYHELTDYWNMSRRLGDSLLTDVEIFPQRLKEAHDICTERTNAADDAQRDEEFKKRYDDLSIYCFEYKGLSIRPPVSASELRCEGNRLSHCVFSYAKKHAEGATAILFIRHTSEPDIPYFTLELDEKKLEVRQNRGKCNCARTEEVIAFEEQWLKFIHKKIKKKKEKVAV